MEKEEKCLLIATRVPDFDMVGDKDYGDRPYGVVLDIYDLEEDFLESGTDWTYFETEIQAEKYVKQFNKQDISKRVFNINNII